MKRSSLAAVTFFLVAVFSLILSDSLIAQQNTEKQNQKKNPKTSLTQTKTNNDENSVGRGVNFIDENGNGICDRFEQGQGKRQNPRHGMRPGKNFIDENGDGICDNRSSGGGMGKGRASGNGHRSKYGMPRRNGRK